MTAIDRDDVDEARAHGQGGIDDGGAAAGESRSDGARVLNAHTDAGFAARFLARVGRDLRFEANSHKWYEYQERSGLWVVDELGNVTQRALAAAEELHREALVEPDKDIKDAMVKFALRYQSAAGITNALSLARTWPSVAMRATDFDADPDVFCTPTAILDTRSGYPRIHRRGDLLTLSSAAALVPGAECPRWERFLREVFLGRERLIDYVQRAVGYCMTGRTNEHAVFIAHGCGQNGKSTFFNALRLVFGSYLADTPVSTLLMQSDDGRPRNDLARLVGKRMVLAVEIDEGKRLDESMVKALSGEDVIVARFLRKEFFEFRPTFKVWIQTNHKPVIHGTDTGIWRRLKLIPFDAVFPSEMRDTALPAILAEEAPGILRWALEGCLAWRKSGLGSCDVVDAATAAYRREQDVLGGFLVDRCDEGPMLSETGERLYGAYKAWAEKNGERPVSNNRFAQQLEERGFRGKRTNRGKVWWGLMVFPEKDSDDDAEGFEGGER